MSTLTLADQRLDDKQISAYYNPETGVLHVVYRGILSPDVSAQFYGWLSAAMAQHPEEVLRARGSIYDFREVTQFDNANLFTAFRQSKNLNQQADLANHPVALVVANNFQAEFVRLTMQITPGHDRKRVVATPEEGLAFIEDFHAKQASG